MVKRELIMGIDDAGRGPLIGPMILAGALLTREQEIILKKAGVKDSKQVLHPARIKLSKLIKDKVVKSFPDEIDKYVSTKGLNLNTLEARKAAEIINFLNDGKEKINVVVDCPSVNPVAWKAKLLEFVKKSDNLEIMCEHKADINHISASSASILAKVAREEEVEKIKKQIGINFGSGYPADPISKEFLKKHGNALKDSGIFRKTWATWKSLFPEKGKKQASLGIFNQK